MTTFERIRTILIGYHGIISDRITPKASCRDLGLSSLDEISVICDIEEAFGIVVPDAYEFAGVADIIAFIDGVQSNAKTNTDTFGNTGACADATRPAPAGRIGERA